MTVTDSKGSSHTITADTVIMIDVTAIGHHPGYWGLGEPPAKSNIHSPTLNFDPSRWLNAEEKGELKDEAAFPFSTGHRMFPRKRFKEVEICAMIARFFSQFSPRLEPNESDIVEANLAKTDQAWLKQKTRDRVANAMFNGLGFWAWDLSKISRSFQDSCQK